MFMDSGAVQGGKSFHFHLQSSNCAFLGDNGTIELITKRIESCGGSWVAYVLAASQTLIKAALNIMLQDLISSSALLEPFQSEWSSTCCNEVITINIVIEVAKVESIAKLCSIQDKC